MGGGAWPFLVGGAICLVNSDNERDSSLLNSSPIRRVGVNFLEGQVAFSHTRLSNNRSVMPLDVRGRTRATLKESACVLPDPKGPGNPLNLLRARDCGLQLFHMNEEFPVSASHKLALITSLPFSHRPSLLPIGWFSEILGLDPARRATVVPVFRKDDQT